MYLPLVPEKEETDSETGTRWTRTGGVGVRSGEDQWCRNDRVDEVLCRETRSFEKKRIKKTGLTKRGEVSKVRT